MKKILKGSLSFLLFFGLIIAETGNTVAEKSKDLKRAQTLVIGRVSDNPKKHHKRLKPIVEYVAGQMKDLGIVQGEVLMAKDNREMIKYLKEGKVDWVTETPFSAIIFSEETGAEIILRRWKKGVPDYYTVFTAHKKSGINRIADLKGKKIAFEDPGSTTAYFVPMSIIRKEGLDLVELPSPRANVPEGKVGYAFAGGELNISTWVHKGLVDAGAYSNLDWEDSSDTPDSFKRNCGIFYRTKPFPRAIEMLRRDIEPGIKKRLKDVLLKAHMDPGAKGALKAYSKTTKFDELTGEAKKGMEEARRILEYMRKEIK